MKISEKLIYTAFLVSACVSSPSRAQTIDMESVVAFGEDDVFTLELDKSYLLVETPMKFPPMLRFMALPTPAEDVDREPQRQNEIAAGTEPVLEQTDLTIERIVAIGPQNRFLRSGHLSLWLYEVPAGEYLFYGFGTGSYVVLAETCMCMGTVRFAVEPGLVTAVRIYGRFVDGQGNRTSEPPDGMSVVDATMHQVMIVEGPTSASLDPRIPGHRIVPATFQPVERLPNLFGGKIARIEPIPGVFAYERDRMVDVQANAGSIVEETTALTSNAAGAPVAEERTTF